MQLSLKRIVGIPRKRVLIHLDGSGWIWLANLLGPSHLRKMVFFLLEERGPRGLFVWDLVNGGYMECTIVSKDSGKGNIHACPPISTGESIHIVSSSYTTPCLVLFWSLGRITPPQRSLQITSQREPGNRLAQVYRPLGAFWLDLWMLGVLVFQLEQQNATLFGNPLVNQAVSIEYDIMP